eukprot:3875846-Prymnesium_polylepis.1
MQHRNVDSRETRGVRKRKCCQHLGGRASSRVNCQTRLAGHSLPASKKTDRPDSNQLARVRMAVSPLCDTQILVDCFTA